MIGTFSHVPERRVMATYLQLHGRLGAVRQFLAAA